MDNPPDIYGRVITKYMKILPAFSDDVPALVSLINSAYRGEGSKKGWTTEADLLDGTRTDEVNLQTLLDNDDGVILKGVNENGIIKACVNLQKQGKSLYLGMLAVSPELQGHGAGKQLLDTAEAYSDQHLCSSIYMTVISVRNELIDWYERHGYQKTGEEIPFPADEKFGLQKLPFNLIVLEKKIKPMQPKNA
jgi:ribosomal protein S18 acetylase RimI-like enzyme